MPLNSENLNLARSLDLSTTNRVLVDSISASNPIDTYRLTVSRSSDLKLSLQGVKANADIQVIQDANGNGRIDAREVLTSSALKGVGLDSINVSLAAGTYFVQAYAGDKGATTGYSLNYSATALGNPDSADLTATRSYFGTGVIRSFYNSRGISTYQNPSSTVVAFGSAQGQPNIFLMYGAIADYYTNNYTKNPSATNGLNGVASGLGNPTSAIYEQADGSSVMDFEGGQLVNRGGVVTPIYSKRGGDRFDLVGQGAPNGTELQWKDDYAWFGRDSVGQATGAVRRISNGYIQEFTGSKDGDSIFLLKDSQQVIGGVEQYKDDNGKLINTPKGGPYRVQGGVLQAYRSVGGAERVDGLGFATFSTERANFKGYKVYQEFENGFIAITKDNQVLIRDRQGQPILPPSPDYAGNTLQAAKSINIGALATYQDFVGTADTNDYYKFTIFSKSSINASLSNLSADANLQLLNSAGTVIGSSNNPGSASEEIYRSLDAGTYYIRAYQASGNTNYNLNIFASQITQTGDVISVRGSDGNLNVFAVGKDDKVWLWKQSDNNYTWWHDMGFTAQNIQVIQGGDGKLHVLGVGKDASTWMWNESDNNYTWWHNMGFGAQNVQATVGGDGKLHVLGVGKDASTWMWNESDNNYTWWHNMGFGAQNVQATVGGDGKLHVLGVGKDASTWMWNESDNNYTWWHNMGFGAQNVQATVGGDGKLHVLGVGKDASTWMWNESDNNYTWWHNMGFGAQNVQATVGGDGKLHVLGVGKDASTWMWNESDNNYTWWHNMGFGARQPLATNGSYFSDLSSLTDDQWDTYSGDNTRFDPNTWDNGVDERSKTPDSIKQVYTDLSVAIFGSRHQMNTGYMYDKSYHDGFGTWHAGFDLEAAVGTSIKTVVGGTIAWTSTDATTGAFIGVNGDDGKQWVYGHMQSIQFAQGARIDAGKVIGVVGSQPGAQHFHLEVETGLSYGKTNGADPDQNHLRNVTVSPLQAFWQWQNKNGKTTTQQPVNNNGAASQSSDAGLKFISRWEGFRSNIYNDPLNATIGFGHKIHDGKINGSEPAEFRNGITESRALELLKDDIAWAEQAVRNTVKVLLTQNQFDALVSFTFNNGSGGLAEMIGLTRLNSGDYASVSSKLNLYVYDNNGNVVDGLVNRRRDEANLFDNGVYG